MAYFANMQKWETESISLSSITICRSLTLKNGSGKKQVRTYPLFRFLLTHIALVQVVLNLFLCGVVDDFRDALNFFRTGHLEAKRKLEECGIEFGNLSANWH